MQEKRIENIQLFDGFSVGVTGWVVVVKLRIGLLDSKTSMTQYDNHVDAEKTMRMLTNIMTELKKND